MKWDLPPEPIPAWLDPACEVTAENDPTAKLPAAKFIPLFVDANLAAGLVVWEAIRVAANALSEVGYKFKCRGNNLGGWKITKAGAKAYEKQHGRKPRWWRAPGNKAPGATVRDLKGGDPPWCYYWAYDSVAEFFTKWRAKFLPKPAAGASRAELETRREETGNYRLAGYLFWNHDDEWFRALCDAGYKGRRTDDDPQPSYEAYLVLAREVGEWWAQAKLRVTVDGAWGPKSQTACRDFQARVGLPATGVLDDTTLSMLAALA